MAMHPFDAAKRDMLQSLQDGIDFSPKGSIDAPVVDLVNFINDHLGDFVTTSSCSGRISVYRDEGTGKGVSWLLVEHGTINKEQVVSAVSKQVTVVGGQSEQSQSPMDGVDRNMEQLQIKKINENALVSLKCEAFILHLRCRDLEAGRLMHSIALAAGFRESGLTVSAKRVMLAVRTTAFGLELPIARGRHLLVDDVMLDLLVEQANERLQENFARADRLLRDLKTRFQYPSLSLQAHNAHKLSAEWQVVRRWGHVSMNVPQGVLVAGGYGQDMDQKGSKRGLRNWVLPLNSSSTPSLVPSTAKNSNADPSFNPATTSVAPAAQPVHTTEGNTIEGEGQKTETAFDGVHGAALSHLWRPPSLGPLGAIAITSGGRTSPQHPLAALTASLFLEREEREGDNNGNNSNNSDKLHKKIQEIQEIQLLHTGEAPSPRWGNVLLALTALDSEKSEEGAYTEEVLRVLLHGGRDGSRVCDGAVYVCTIRVVGQEGDAPSTLSTQPSQLNITLSCEWEEVAYCGPRFFHAASVVSALGEGGSGCAAAMQLSASVLLHGGLSGLSSGGDISGNSSQSDNNNNSDNSALTCVEVCFHGGADAGVTGSHCYVVSTQGEGKSALSIPRFGHSLSPTGTHTYALVGGTSIDNIASISSISSISIGGGHEEEEFDFDEDSPQDLSTATATGSGSGGDSGSGGVRLSLPLVLLDLWVEAAGRWVCSYRTAPSQAAVDTDRNLIANKTNATSGTGTGIDMSCHLHGSSVWHRQSKSLLLVGGGSHVLAFGQTYCVSISLALSAAAGKSTTSSSSSPWGGDTIFSGGDSDSCVGGGNIGSVHPKSAAGTTHAVQTDIGASAILLNEYGENSRSQSQQSQQREAQGQTQAQAQARTKENVWFIVVPSAQVKLVKTCFDHFGWLSKDRRIAKLDIEAFTDAVSVAREVFKGDVDTLEEVRAASIELKNGRRMTGSWQFERLGWLGLSTQQRVDASVGAGLLTSDSVDPLDARAAKRAANKKDKKDAKETKDKKKDKKEEKENREKEEEDVFVVPVKPAFLQLLAQNERAENGTTTQEAAMTALFARLHTPYLALFSQGVEAVAGVSTPNSTASSTTAATTAAVTATAAKTITSREQKALEYLRGVCERPAYRSFFSSTSAAMDTLNSTSTNTSTNSSTHSSTGVDSRIGVPRKFEIVGDVLMLPECSFTGRGWEKIFIAPLSARESESLAQEGCTAHVNTSTEFDADGTEELSELSELSGDKIKEIESLWKGLALCFGPKIGRVARRAKVDCGPKRESAVVLLLPHAGRPPLPPLLTAQTDEATLVGGSTKLEQLLPALPSWVTVTENGVRFSFDITRIMFCSGNVTERMRMARQDTQGQTIVDLYCGIGYYTLPFLVHGRAHHVHALEWNPFSVASIRHNLRNNGVKDDRYTVYVNT